MFGAKRGAVSSSQPAQKVAIKRFLNDRTDRARNYVRGNSATDPPKWITLRTASSITTHLLSGEFYGKVRKTI